jgi:pyridoxine kinase
VEQVGKIARERKAEAARRPGSFFWVLDPVMGDNGRIYVAEDTVPVYKTLLKDADLILPNQFEAELLSEVQIRDLATMKQAITKLHQVHNVPHVLITSIRLPPTAVSTPTTKIEDSWTVAKLSVIGSTATSDSKPRLFRITVPALPVFFSGTGDMFAATLVARLRQAARKAGILDRPSWRSDDIVTGVDLPLARAAEMVLASMHAILRDTAQHYNQAAKMLDESSSSTSEGVSKEDQETQRHLRLTRAAEVRVVRNSKALLEPPDLGNFKAQPIVLEGEE